MCYNERKKSKSLDSKHRSFVDCSMFSIHNSIGYLKQFSVLINVTGLTTYLYCCICDLLCRSVCPVLWWWSNYVCCGNIYSEYIFERIQQLSSPSLCLAKYTHMYITPTSTIYLYVGGHVYYVCVYNIQIFFIE